MADTAEEVRKQIRFYVTIGLILGGFTILTVFVGLHPWFDIPPTGVDGRDILAGLLIAAFKASLVVLIFMHLNHERLLIYKFLLFTVVFVVGLFALTYLAHSDPIHWNGFDKRELFQAPPAKLPAQ